MLELINNLNLLDLLTQSLPLIDSLFCVIKQDQQISNIKERVQDASFVYPVLVSDLEYLVTGARSNLTIHSEMNTPAQEQSNPQNQLLTLARFCYSLLQMKKKDKNLKTFKAVTIYIKPSIATRDFSNDSTASFPVIQQTT